MKFNVAYHINGWQPVECTYIGDKPLYWEYEAEVTEACMCCGVVAYEDGYCDNCGYTEGVLTNDKYD